MNATEEQVRSRVEEVTSRIEAACVRAGRDPKSVTLIAVIKTFGPEMVRALHGAGLRHFGESYAQDLRDKAAALADLPDLHWHYIGRVQTNKVRYLAGTAELIHAVDRLTAAEAISARIERDGASPPGVLVSVNLAGEDTKGGVRPSDVTDLCAAVEALPGVRLRGLMCIPPWYEDPERSRPWYRELRALGDRIRGKMRDPEVFHLSMGMSHDVEVAIEEGATLVRVGTALVGERKRGETDAN